MTIIFVIIGAYLFVCVLAYLFQSQLVFFPDRKLVATPADVGLAYEDVYFDTEDGVRLHGWLVPRGEAADVLLFFHGNAGNISHRLESIRLFYDLGLSTFIFDYRSYGQSGGRITESGTYADARAAWRYLSQEAGYSPNRILYFGRSLGGAVAVELAGRHTPRALIVESSFTSIPDLGSRVYPWLPVRLLARIQYDSGERISRLDCPKLFIHSRDDEMIPYGLGRRLYNVAAGPKQFLTIHGGHNEGFILSRGEYLRGLREFLDSLTATTPSEIKKKDM